MGNEVTVLGLGNMGRALAHAFTVAGHAVVGWNRTSRPLGGLDVSVASSVVEALAASPVSVLCVSDNDIVRSWMTDPSVCEAMVGRTIVNLNSSTPSDARELATEIARHGASYLDGFIPLYPEYIGNADAGIIYAGAEAIWEANRELLSALGGRSWWMGENVEAPAALFMGVVVSYFHVALGSFVESAEYARRHGASLSAVRRMGAEITEIIKHQVDGVVDAMESGDFSTDQAHVQVHWETVTMAAEAMKDISTTRQLHVAPLIADLERAKAAGLSHEAIGSIAALLR